MMWHLAHLCERSNNRLLPLYVALPNDRVGFMSLYRAIAKALPSNLLIRHRNHVHEGGSQAARSWESRYRDLSAALWVMAHGSHHARSNAQRWLTAEKGTTVSQVQAIGIDTPIRDSDRAVAVLCGAVELLTQVSGNQTRVVLMIDEFQRAGELTKAALAGLNNGMQRLFDSVQQRLSIFLSFTFGEPENIRFILSDALLDRADPRDLKLPPISESEGIQFMRDLLRAYHQHGSLPDFYPFTEEAVEVGVRHAISSRKGTSPRDLIQVFDLVLGESVADDLIIPNNRLTACNLRAILDRSDAAWRR